MTKKTDDSVVTTALSGVEYISSGIEEIDVLVGGWPKGRITELWGNPGTGKSYVLARTMAALPEKAKCLYIDAEYSLVKQRLVDLGVDVSKVAIVQDGRLERVTKHIVEVVAAGTYDLIIIDSLAKLIPLTIETNEVGDLSTVALYARLIKHFEAQLKPKLAVSKTALVAINQARAGMGPMNPAKPQGGFAWEHSIDLRLKLLKPMQNKIYKQVAGEKTQIGHWCEIRVEKSRLTPPYIKTRFRVDY